MCDKNSKNILLYRVDEILINNYGKSVTTDYESYYFKSLDKAIDKKKQLVHDWQGIHFRDSYTQAYCASDDNDISIWIGIDRDHRVITELRVLIFKVEV